MRLRRLTLLIAVTCAITCAALAHTGCVRDDGTTSGSMVTIASTEPTDPPPTLTPTPSPTVSPTPTPSPTPVPNYVEPKNSTPKWYNGFVDPRTVRATVVEDPESVDTLVNKYYTLESDYVPSDLVNVSHSKSQQLRSAAAEAYLAMYDACKEATGKGLYLVSGYRSYQIQAGLFTRAINNRGLAFAVKRNAYQGRSEHQLGLALDLCPEGQTVYTDDFGSTTVGKWVNENCYRYGFIRRYQADYINETGYDNEAWHYRYVGEELATYLYENNMSLEAYWGRCQVMPGDE
ncbi:D-alanyl-D-alanine carboxypeptidase [Ruminococcaceae bacterium YRB3002]|nr:D-alanyl-D-alanine carboxypeptidase [Ruminococcaceae bacterium YRB3002]